MSLFHKIISKEEKISVIGLGYVGLPLAISFARKFGVIGYDRNEYKIQKYHEGIDVTEEVGDLAVQNTSAVLSNDVNKIKECKFHVVAVPTPINEDKTPNLNPVISASETVGKHLTKGSIVVYESTVYPGVTEDICIPILERESGLKHGEDFKVGYSPERINPGDKVHRLETIVKVVSGSDEESLETIAKVYEEIIEAGVHRASCIKVAEAAKVIENSQRDINIAFMNELSIIFNEMDIDTKEVLEAASTKWNFLNFFPGLVGGHCIGVDPYYLTYKAEQMGYHSQIILSGRKINDDMGKFVAQNTVKQLIKGDKHIKGSKVGIMGVTFKENCPDVRNTKVVDVISELEEYGIEVKIFDPVADIRDLNYEYGIETVSEEVFNNLDALIIAVSHDEFKKYEVEHYKNIINGDNKIIIDVKGILNRKTMLENNFIYWRL